MNERNIAKKLLGPGGPMEMVDEVIQFEDGNAPHHKGVTYKVFKKPMPQTMVDLYNIPMMRGFADRTFLVYENERYTFQETFQLAAELGFALKNKLGVEKGDRVSVCMRNYPEYILTIIATTSIGACVVPTNSWWTSKELEYGLNNSESKIVICDEEILKRLTPVLDNIPSITRVLLARSNSLPHNHEKLSLFNDIILSGKGETMPEFPCGPEDNAILLYTSGTTGHPKGVVLTHRGISHSMNAIMAMAMVGKAMSPKQKKKALNNVVESLPAVLLMVPLFHATGLHAIFLVSLLVGRKLVMMKGKFDPRRALELIQNEKVTQVTAVPTMLLEIMQHPDFSKFDTSTLENFGGGGAPPPPSIVKDVGKKFKKAKASNGYGSSETNSLGTFNTGDSYAKRPTSCGRPLPGLILEIWDEQGKQLPANVPGRVMIKGANVMKEYWRNPEATAKAISPDGYYDTGDIGKLDEEGYLFLLDRAKDLIIRGGENISCAEVEAAVYECEYVSEAAVVGVEHPTLQEEVGVAILPKPGCANKITLDHLRNTVCTELSSFKKPAHVYIYSERLPRGATGKILKKEIRKHIKEGVVKPLPSASSKL